MSETLGRTLEKARIGLGKSLSDAEGTTFIRSRMLAALESGDWDALPDPAYVRGYIQNYAKFLGLDPAPLLAMYERETGTGRRAPIQLPEPVVTPRSQRHVIPPRTAVAIVVVIALLSLAVYGVTRLSSDSESTPPLPAPSESTPDAGDTAEPTNTPGVASPSGEPTSSDAEPDAEAVPEQFSLRVVVSEESSSWLRVTVDGLIAYEGTMAGGQSREWFVAEEAAVRVGRPSAVTIYRDDSPVEIPSGDPPTVTLTSE